MKQASDILEELVNVEVGVKCLKCGAVPTLVGKQYSIRCPVCGTYISFSPGYLAKLKECEYRSRHGEMEERYRCSICQDSGLVILEEQVDETLTKYAYRCLCKAGQRRKEAWPVVSAAKVLSVLFTE